MKRYILIVVLTIIFTIGCNKQKTALSTLKDYLESFKRIDNDVKKEIDIMISKYSLDERKLYKKIYVRQYKNLEYNVISEEYDGDKALINVMVNVYDLNKAYEKAEEYLKDNTEKFSDENNNIDVKKYELFKLNYVLKCEDKTDYEITFYLHKKDGVWSIEEPNDYDLEKLNGIYVE